MTVKKEMDISDLKVNPEEMPFTIDLIKYVNKYRPALELLMCAVLNAKFSSFVNTKGRGINLVGGKALGKGELLKATFNLTKKTINFDVDKFTMSFLTRFAKELNMELLDFELIIEDLSATVDSGYPEIFFNITSKLIWDKKCGSATADSYKDGVRIEKSRDVTIEVNSFNAMCGMTNEIFGKIKRFEAYSSMWIDRYTNLFPIRTLHQQQRIDREINYDLRNEYEKITAAEIREYIIELLKKHNVSVENFPKTMLPFKSDISNELYNYCYNSIYRYEHTPSRGNIYFKGDLSINALLNGRKEITKSDLAFYMLLRPNFILYEFSPIIQSLAQNCGFCSDMLELGQRLDLNFENIPYRISQSKNAYEILNYEGDIVTHSDKMAKALFRQETFINGVVDL